MTKISKKEAKELFKKPDIHRDEPRVKSTISGNVVRVSEGRNATHFLDDIISAFKSLIPQYKLLIDTFIRRAKMIPIELSTANIDREIVISLFGSDIDKITYEDYVGILIKKHSIQTGIATKAAGNINNPEDIKDWISPSGNKILGRMDEIINIFDKHMIGSGHEQFVMVQSAIDNLGKANSAASSAEVTKKHISDLSNAKRIKIDMYHDCIPCWDNVKDRFKLSNLKAKDMWEFIGLAYLSKLSTLLEQLIGLKSLLIDNFYLDTLCQMTSLIDFNCVPNLTALYALVSASIKYTVSGIEKIMGKYKFELGGWKELLRPLADLLLSELSKLKTTLLLPVDCVLSAMHENILKLAPNEAKKQGVDLMSIYDFLQNNKNILDSDANAKIAEISKILSSDSSIFEILERDIRELGKLKIIFSFIAQSITVAKQWEKIAKSNISNISDTICKISTDGMPWYNVVDITVGKLRNEILSKGTGGNGGGSSEIGKVVIDTSIDDSYFKDDEIQPLLKNAILTGDGASGMDKSNVNLNNISVVIKKEVIDKYNSLKDSSLTYTSLTKQAYPDINGISTVNINISDCINKYNDYSYSQLQDIINNWR